MESAFATLGLVSVCIRVLTLWPELCGRKVRERFTGLVTDPPRRGFGSTVTLTNSYWAKSAPPSRVRGDRIASRRLPVVASYTLEISPKGFRARRLKESWSVLAPSCRT